jgi:acyl-CoA thioesterase FadM
VDLFEVAASGEVHPDAVLRWIQVAVFEACAQVGWTTTRRVAANFVVLQMRHDLEFFCYPRVEDRVHLISRYVDSHRLRGTWLHEIHRLPGNDLLVRDYSTGVFVDLQGRPSTPPVEMARDLHYGAPR